MPRQTRRGLLASVATAVPLLLNPYELTSSLSLSRSLFLSLSLSLCPANNAFLPGRRHAEISFGHWNVNVRRGERFIRPLNATDCPIMLDLYRGRIQKDDVISCNTANLLITASRIYFAERRVECVRPVRSIPLRVTPRSPQTWHAASVASKKGCKKSSSSTAMLRGTCTWNGINGTSWPTFQ